MERATFNSTIDEISDEKLSLFQKDFLKSVNYWIEKSGKYIYIKSLVYKHYIKIMNQTEIDKEINELVQKKLIKVQHKRSIFKGDFVTNYSFTLNIQLLEKPTSLNYGFSKN